MRRCGIWIVISLLLAGCTRIPEEMETGMELRSKLLQASTCTFKAIITADYGDKIHTFSMSCQSDSQGDLTFSVTEPDTISGISGNLSGKEGALIFDETALCFDLIAEDQLSPISAPWILMKTLRSGYLTSACTESGRIRLSIDDSYEQDSLRLDVWLNQEQEPEHADILYDGRRILSVAVENFEIL